MSGAAAAAAAAKRRQQQEEEEMTQYTERELQEGWEFKFLRSATGAFRSPERFRKALEEERAAGWILVEKFDDGRIRLKRPASARSSGSGSGADPYRTWIGFSERKLAFVILAAVFGGMAFLFGLLAALKPLR
jgi:hypothetical protein